MINTIEELLDDVFYDWGFSPSPQINEDVDEDKRSFNINKTYIYFEKGKYFLSYKVDKTEVSELAFNQFCKIVDKVIENPSFEETLTEYHNLWMDNKHESDPEFIRFLNEIKGVK